VDILGNGANIIISWGALQIPRNEEVTGVAVVIIIMTSLVSVVNVGNEAGKNRVMQRVYP
jgi:hypothetical protein